jgi:hypothetical protein
MNLDRTIGNILGYLSIAVALFLWAFLLSTTPAEFSQNIFNPTLGTHGGIVGLFILSLLLPPFASRKNSKLWLLMLLNPAAWLVFLKLRP